MMDHGYISQDDWPAQQYEFLEAVLQSMSIGKGRSGIAVGTRKAVRSSRHALEEDQMQKTYLYALAKQPLHQHLMLLHNLFASLTMQTAMRPLEMSNIVSLDLSMAVRSDLKFGKVHLFELGGVGKAKANAVAEICVASAASEGRHR